MNEQSRNKRFKLLNLIIVLTAIPMFFGMAVGAQSQTQPTDKDYNLRTTACKAGLPCGNVSPVEIVTTLINIVLSVVGVLAVVMIIYGGVTWMTSSGNEEKIKKARGLLANAVIGLAIILTAFAVSSFIFRILQRSTYTPAPANGSQCASQSGVCIFQDTCTINTGFAPPWTDLGPSDCDQSVQQNTCCVPPP